MAGPIILPSGSPKWPPTWGDAPECCCGGYPDCENSQCVEVDFSVRYETIDNIRFAILKSNHCGNPRNLVHNWAIDAGPIANPCARGYRDFGLGVVQCLEGRCCEMRIPAPDYCLYVVLNMFFSSVRGEITRKACYGYRVKGVGNCGGSVAVASAAVSATGDNSSSAESSTLAQDSNFLLGDYTEQLLSSLGVTKDRYSAAKELFGLAPTCDCQVRKEWLNKVGAWLGL
jgi:hypothetical protein